MFVHLYLSVFVSTDTNVIYVFLRLCIMEVTDLSLLCEGRGTELCHSVCFTSLHAVSETPVSIRTSCVYGKV